MTPLQPLPNFLVAGAMKAGSTALYHYLGLHPDIDFPSLKEPKFFIAPELLAISAESWQRSQLLADAVLDLDAYKALYSGSVAARRGDASPQYALFAERTAPRIRALLGDVPIVLVLRDPVARAWSGYRWARKHGFRGSFDDLVWRQPELRARQWPPMWRVLEAGYYSVPITVFRRWFTTVTVALTEDLEADPFRVTSRIVADLGLDPARLPNDARLSVRHNANPDDEPLPDALAERLRELYREEVGRLEVLLQRDLSLWRGSALPG